MNVNKDCTAIVENQEISDIAQQIRNKVEVEEEEEQQNKKVKLDWKNYLFDEGALRDSIEFKKWNKQYTQEEVINIELDLHRTRHEEIFFQKKKVCEDLKSIAVFYCRSNNVKYQQGLLEIIVPFLLLKTESFKLEKCYAYFNSFMQKYFPTLLLQKIIGNSSDLPHLRTGLYLCTELLNYHSPQIIQLFRKFDIDLNIFATAWLMTLFIKDTQIEYTYIILDKIITKNSKAYLFYLVVGLILLKENDILQYQNDLDESNLLILLTQQLKITNSKQHIIKWFKSAEKIEQNTPKSFGFHMAFLGFYDREMMSIQDINVLVNHEKKDIILTVYPSEIADYLYSEAQCQQQLTITDEFYQQNTNQIEFILLDLRSSTDIEKCYVKFSRKLIDYGFVFQAQYIQEIANFIDSFNQYFHICLMINDTTNPKNQQFNHECQLMIQLVQLLQKNGRKYVSKLAGGFVCLENELILKNKSHLLCKSNKDDNLLNKITTKFKNIFT